ncbi:MAG: hypothetical protein CMJ18_22925 [Phycisphaeraceae bacterium]|nr:hypothetical protein [Phycisphaeraceae bacterium]
MLPLRIQIALIIGVAALNATGDVPDARLVGLGVNYLSLAPVTPASVVVFDKTTGVPTLLPRGYALEIDRLGENLAADTRGRLFNVFSVPSLSDPALGAAHLNRLHPQTGEIVDRIPFGDGTAFPPFVFALAFDSRDEMVISMLSSNPLVDATPVLARVDLATGLATELTDVDRTFTGLAFDPGDNLYGVNPDDGLVRIDVNTGVETVIGGDLAGAATFGPTPSVAFDHDGTLYASADSLWIVDPATGATTPVGDHSGSLSFVGLTIRPVPEPCSAGLLAGVALVLIADGRRWPPRHCPSRNSIERRGPRSISASIRQTPIAFLSPHRPSSTMHSDRRAHPPAGTCSMRRADSASPPRKTTRSSSSCRGSTPKATSAALPTSTLYATSPGHSLTPRA